MPRLVRLTKGSLGAIMTCITATCNLACSDEGLLACLAAGDHDALEELFRRHRALAYRVAYRLLGNEADAPDAVQEGFIKALTHLQSYQGRSSFKTWLLRVVANAALDLGRQRGRREMISLDAQARRPEESLEPAVTVNHAGGLEQGELRVLLDEALGTLPEAQRQTFVLHADGELSYREVAEVLGISIGTVMSRIFYARQKLRAYLRPRTKL